MIEQMTSTYVGVVGMLGFSACVVVGIFIYMWFMKEIRDGNGNGNGTQDT